MAADTVPTTEAERDARALHGADEHGGHRIDPAEIAIGVVIGRTSEFFDFFVYAIASVLVFPKLVFPHLDPPTGTLYRGDTVSLSVSLGPELVEVPQVKARGVEAATDLLEGLGFEVQTKQADIYLGIGYVSSSDPSAGDEVPKGSTITLFVV